MQPAASSETKCHLSSLPQPPAFLTNFSWRIVSILVNHSNSFQNKRQYRYVFLHPRMIHMYVKRRCFSSVLVSTLYRGSMKTRHVGMLEESKKG